MHYSLTDLGEKHPSMSFIKKVPSSKLGLFSQMQHYCDDHVQNLPNFMMNASMCPVLVFDGDPPVEIFLREPAKIVCHSHHWVR